MSGMIKCHSFHNNQRQKGYSLNLYNMTFSCQFYIYIYYLLAGLMEASMCWNSPPVKT